MYCGRFAPSPTGPLHFGSLVAAVASWLDARAHGGRWLVRIEDVDEPRCRAEWADAILRTLERLGLHWDGAVVRQSGRKELYHAALERLRQAGLAYPCGCTRREAAGRYPGTCRAGLPPGRAPRAWRFRVPAGRIGFQDRWQGWFEQDVEAEAGDFILLRADGFFAYQLAVVVDDAAQGVTHVVRGADLLDSTPRQLLLQRALGYPRPAYLHHPVATDGEGRKLSKQNRAPALDPARDRENLLAALAFLGLAPPDDLCGAELLAWARGQWVPRLHSLGV
ncbi:MAG: tRNA glutamyl-Q(34) synthetase GluQRS [Bryobacteraceae bacterium]|nr:tRNA glutamyl-Q(34) synthetase GluQRS [Bryobacteraceae bacterium]MCX7603737.1 tRNA glutamyl-Q(34) synthetase GluQRS [Bryobacteraceae bacterium]